MGRKKQEKIGPTFFTTFQVAKFLGVSPPTVVNWVNSGLLSAHRTPGGHRRLRLEDVVAFARAHNYPVAHELSGAPNDAPPSARRVLIVDDEFDFAQTAADYLQLKGNFEVEIAGSGFSAGVAVARFRPAVVLMDILMPDMDGFEVLRMLRKDPQMKTTPVIACTAFRDAATEQRARAEGFDGYIEKPIKFERLMELVEDSLRNGKRG
ncbi:MAG: response regulator [Myxococcales bacterium]|nr:response regulator [Myxococcales bacterium]